MPFDGIVTYAITTELKTALIGGRINKIYQPTKTELVLTIRNNSKNYSLLLSIHPTYARMHLTDYIYRNPDEPPMFCMILRKHLAGAIIEDIMQTDLERIVTFQCRSMNEIGDQETKALTVELMGRHSNVLLLTEDKTTIIHCLKTVPPFQNRYRSIVPGAAYILPPEQHKLNLLTVDSETLMQRLDFNAGKLDQQITQQIAGMSKMVGKEIVHLAGLGGAASYKTQFEHIQKTVLNHSFIPAIYQNDREDFHVIPMKHLENMKRFSTANEMADVFYSNKAERDRVKQQAKDMSRMIKNELDKNKRKLSIHEQTIKKASSAEDFKIKGELLTANMHLVQKGDKDITVINYYDPEQVEWTLHLQTDKTPSENAQHFFKKYRKLQAAQKKAQTEIIKTKKEIAYLGEIIQQIENARDEDLEDIREELQEEGYIKKQKKKKRKRNNIQPEKFIATDGTTIYVGRNNKQNEYVTHKLAHKSDIWLHTLNIPGSHVVIKAEHPAEETLTEAAMIAAYYSKARESASVPVDYTYIKYVKKPSGAKPGFVIYTDQKTIHVTPDEKKIQQLKHKG